TLLSDFVLIRLWGLGNSLVLVAGLNTAVALAAFTITRLSAKAPTTPEGHDEEPAGAIRTDTWMLLLAMAGGFLVLFQEIVWTHMMGQFLDNSVYGFAVALFATIAGLGLGALLVARHVAKYSAETLLVWTSSSVGILIMV